MHKSDDRIQVQVERVMEASITRSELGYALMAVVRQMVGGEVDDAGCDWYTDSLGRTLIGETYDWCVSADGNVAALVDAANVLKYGKLYKR